MHIQRKSPTLLEIDGIVRVEAGPLRKQATATKELLSDEVTATHYHAPRKEIDPKTGKAKVDPDTGKEIVTIAIDALGKPIKLGQTMDYIDWKNRERCWTVYELKVVDLGKDKNNKPTSGERFVPHGSPHASEDAALSAATTLAVERAAAA